MKENNKNVAIIFLLLMVVLLWSKLNHLSDINNELEDNNNELEEQVSSYKESLDQANSNIDEAKYYTWESYDEMGEALDNLETVENH